MKKTILAIMAGVFVAVCANAQEVVDSTSVETPVVTEVTDSVSKDYLACKEYFNHFPNDTFRETFVEGNTQIIRSVYMKNGKIIAREDTITVVPAVSTAQRNRQIAALDTLSVKSRVEHSIRGSQEVDILYGYSADAQTLRANLNGDSSDVNAGRIVLKRANKYGWSAGVHFGYSYNPTVDGIIAGGGVGYEKRWWGIDVFGEAGKSRYSYNAVNHGKEYWTFRTEANIKFRPIQLDRLDQNRLFVFGGFGFENTQTDSKPNADGSYLTSRGNYLYGTAGVSYEYRFFATGNVLGARLQWRDGQAIVQNATKAECIPTVTLSFYFEFGFSRDKVNNRK